MAKVTQDFGEILKSAAPIISPKIGEVVTGKILSISSKMFLVDLNSQFTGIIAGSDMHSSIDDVSKLKVDDIVESIVIGDDKDGGLVILSIRKASQAKLITRLHSNFDTKEIITVIPNEANKGGLLIDLDGIKGFIPVSQLTPTNYPRVEGANAERILAHLNKLVGKPFKVRVINVDPDGKKIIFSEKAAVEEERGVALGKLKIGDQVEGVVSGILTYGLFITFSGLEGLVHVSEIDWGHVNDPSKFAKVGDKVKVEVIGIDTDKISLSMKRLKHNPWDELAKKYKVGDIIKAPVMRISKFGIFLSLDGGISGLIHLSEISNEMVKNAEDHVKVGDVVEAKVITFDPTEKRIGLSLKTTEEVVAEVKEEKKAPAKKAKKEEETTEVSTEEVVAEVKEEKKAPAKKAKKEEASAE
ncbi:MAG: S1 RNA-binding domain-containing protein [Candidatus Gracilibacteria bacterium]|nr:S1 RNA-binding domain-containing protein [Candidatus Gracilibacteria bacterium]MDD2908620.1 S1 RNA-binding domain-containing protein [Candidatus Gracilibacteria bacterium]